MTNNIMIPFKEKYSIEHRKNETMKVKQRYPDRIPVIITKNNQSSIANINNEKFLIPESLTICQLIQVIRERIKINEFESINVFIITLDNNEILPSSGASILSIYNEHVESRKDHPKYDGYLYVVYSGENVFG
jgi:GABA(A) receptor-associated protein